MANYCYNWISFDGSKTALNKLEEKLKTYDKAEYFTEWSEYVIGKGELDGGEGFEKKYGTDFGVYYMYGTKWFDFEIECNDNGLIVIGDSAWSPPIKLVEEICKKYELEACIEYEEPGCGFAGRTTFNQSGIVKDEEYSYGEWRYIENIIGWESDLSSMFTDEHLTLEDVLEDCPYAKKEEIEEIYNDAMHKVEENNK